MEDYVPPAIKKPNNNPLSKYDKKSKVRSFLKFLKLIFIFCQKSPLNAPIVKYDREFFMELGEQKSPG